MGKAHYSWHGTFLSVTIGTGAATVKDYSPQCKPQYSVSGEGIISDVDIGRGRLLAR